MHRILCWKLGLLFVLSLAGSVLLGHEPQLLESSHVHLRSGSVREWDTFPETASRVWEHRFKAAPNSQEQTLQLEQQDVKQVWRVTLNEKLLGELHRDENSMRVYFRIPPGTLREGENLLRIAAASQEDKLSDDIRVGRIALLPQRRDEVLSAAKVVVRVVDENKQALPCRLTLIHQEGALQTVAAESRPPLAVRPGTVYTATGEATFGVPAGKYTLYAGRGFEYSLAEATFEIRVGDEFQLKLVLRREVPTAGYAACDTHIHTLTHSGHGDATIEERMITLAGEGIELPVATDHNLHIRYDDIAERLQVRQHFTPIAGNEVTTPVGHFNVFPVNPGARIPNHRLNAWEAIFREIRETPGVEVIILNHARDLHSNVRPFGPALHLALVGDNRRGWPMEFNAMEVINSGATQTEILQLLQDWMSLLNRGYMVTPVGSSDSHDVSRHFVGQGRTYIRCDDQDPGAIDIPLAVRSFRQGQVQVSYGLLAELTIADRFRSGDLVPVTGDEVKVAMRVLGPHWVAANEIQLYANGTLIRQQKLPDVPAADLPPGIKWQGEWMLPRPPHDVHLVAVALGPGIEGSFWKTAKPYQPTSVAWNPRNWGCSGAVWLDLDGDGKATPARTYAERLFQASPQLSSLVSAAQAYDSAVLLQAVHLWERAGGQPLADEYDQALQAAMPPRREMLHSYRDAWRIAQMTRE